MEFKPAPPTINPLLMDSKKEEIRINENILLLISNNENFMKFETKIPNDFPKKKYELIITLEQLQEMNTYFKMFNDLNEIQNCLINEYKSGRISFKVDEIEIKLIILNMILNSEIEINIPRIEFIPDIKDIYNIIINMDKKIKNLETENKNLKMQIEENRTKINFLENYLNIYNIRPNYSSISFSPLSNNNNNFFLGSNIIKGNDIDILINFLPKKPKKITILFNSLIHGDKIQNFHNNVSNKSPTYIIIKTKKDRIFGGYTTHVWNENNCGIYNDDNAFVFSLDNKKKYKIKNSSNAIVDKDKYIQFGTCCFRINNKCTETENLEEDEDYEMTKLCLSGENNFLIKSYEVFLIEYKQT